MAGVQEVLVERYELLEVLGRGGMGVVYRARDRVLDRVVAVKMLPLDRAQDSTAVARFEREARAAAALSHRNIVAVFDFGADAETRFIVMEYLRGQSLAELVHEQGAIAVGEAVEIIAQVAEALAAAHAAGIVHRDIKPANVMVDDHGHVKVLDFGIARLTSGTSLTQTAMVIGSAAYLAPELIRGTSADARSDIYAIGCVLYELLAGQPPFTGELAAAVLHQHNTAAPAPLTRLNPAVPAALDGLVQSMLAKEPSDRPQDADAVISALSAVDVAGEEGVATLPLGDAIAATLPLEAPTRVIPARPTTRAAASGSRTRGAVLAAAVLVLGLLVFVLLGSTGGPKAAPGAHTGRKSGTTNTNAVKHPTTSTASTNTATNTVATNTASTPQTVDSAVASIGTLAARDLQAGTVATPAANAIIGDAQGLLTASQNGQSGPALAGLVKLGSDITSAAQHGQISASALRGLNGAAASLGTALERAAGSTVTTQTTPGPGQQAGGPHAGGPPPGHAKKPGGDVQQGQNDQ
ncbi:MAG TPA: protein kinase [Solirubrobacteraceae bacterium]|jgi:serine/threonine-protein kinase|nr:protein kinase [Solirubrobacteraceae bacterium]